MPRITQEAVQRLFSRANHLDSIITFYANEGNAPHFLPTTLENRPLGRLSARAGLFSVDTINSYTLRVPVNREDRHLAITSTHRVKERKTILASYAFFLDTESWDIPPFKVREALILSKRNERIDIVQGRDNFQEVAWTFEYLNNTGGKVGNFDRRIGQIAYLQINPGFVIQREEQSDIPYGTLPVAHL